MVTDIEVNKQFLPRINQLNNTLQKQDDQDVKFTDTLSSFVSDVNSLQKNSADLTDKMIKGEAVELHDVMIASEKAKTSFQLLVEMRNKFTDLYHEVLRMQV